jgi:endonuclease/exonuclease/phosphatase (EEP) superfamily protein YafD
MMRQEAGLVTADIGTQQTWGFRGLEKMEKLARCVSMTRYPTPGNIRSLGDKHLDSFGGQLDAVLYRGSNIRLLSTRVVPIQSDHRGIITTFEVG